jgi:uncharacterized protein
MGFADFRGNRQYISTGNLMTDDRVSLFFMDYATKTRLKLLGRARVIGLEDLATMASLEMPDYRARVERGVLVHIEGFDWNCPQHITERVTLDEVREITAPLHARIAALEAALSQRSSKPPANGYRHDPI